MIYLDSFQWDCFSTEYQNRDLTKKQIYCMARQQDPIRGEWEKFVCVVISVNGPFTVF